MPIGYKMNLVEARKNNLKLQFIKMDPTVFIEEDLDISFVNSEEELIEKIKFDIAFDNVNEIVANTYSKVKELNISNEQKRKIFTDLDKYVDNGNKKFIQLNNKEIYIKAHNYYTNAYQFVIDKNLK